MKARDAFKPYIMHRRYFLLFTLFYSLLISCESQKVFTKEGIIQLRFRDYDSTEHKYVNKAFMTDLSIWYKNNFVIEEIKTIKTSDSDGVITLETPIAYYLFIDRDTKAFYNYSSFSDTARILDKYTQADTAEIKGLGGWSFYREHKLNVDSLKFLSDTTLDNIVYRRVQILLNVNDILRPTLIYLRCDKKGTVFLFDKNLSEKLDCPIVRIDYLPTSKNPSPVSSEIVFIKDSLTKEEQRVFEAWEKNMKKYPVGK